MQRREIKLRLRESMQYSSTGFQSTVKQANKNVVFLSFKLFTLFSSDCNFYGFKVCKKQLLV